MRMDPVISLNYGCSLLAMKKMNNLKYDLALCDPPYFPGPNRQTWYGVGKTSVGVERRKYPKMSSKNWKPPKKAFFDQLLRVSKNQIIWGINYYKHEHIKNIGPGRIIWDKCNDGSKYSNCEIASCSLITSVKVFRFMWNGMIQGSGMIHGHIAQGNKAFQEKRIHPTQKPIALSKWCLLNFAKPGDKILVTHGGSMGEAIACHDLNFDLDLWEKERVHFDNGTKRYQNYIRQLQMF